MLSPYWYDGMMGCLNPSMRPWWFLNRLWDELQSVRVATLWIDDLHSSGYSDKWHFWSCSHAIDPVPWLGYLPGEQGPAPWKSVSPWMSDP